MTKIIKPLDDGKKKILSLDEAMEQLDAYKPKPNNGESSDEIDKAIAEINRYIGLQWELGPAKAAAGKVDWVMTYDESLARLRKAGYERHPRPAEVFGLMAAHLEGKLADFLGLAKVAEGIDSEWLSLALKTKKDKLICILDPENIKWKNAVQGYYVDDKDLKCTATFTFDITGLPCETYVAIDLLSDELARLLYGRKYADLPEEMQKTTIYIPGPGGIWPICGPTYGTGGIRLYNTTNPNRTAKSRGVKKLSPEL